MTSYGTQGRYSDQRFAAADGSVGDFPPLYSDLPFSRRRKYGRSSDQDVIKWAMRCVLASPVLVLVLWTVGAFVFANNHVASNTSQVMKQKQAQMASPQMLMAQQGFQSQPVMMMQAQPLQMQQEQPQMQQPIMMMPLEQQQLLPLQQAPEIAQPQMQQPLEQEPLMQQTMQEQPIMQRTKKIKNQRTNNVINQRPSQPQQPMAIQQQQPIAIQQQQQQQPPQPQVFYYEPSHAMANGKLEAPMIVYDLNGNPIPLQSLRGAQIFVEPPMMQQQVQAPRKTMSTQDIQKWGESTTQDQSIIVATVAVMALLVGAISARRMRSRNILSSCIENEALEDDVAYDTAYTTRDNSYYNTFASGGWKGDLEKFDV